MDQIFFGKISSTCQSTPLANDHSSVSACDEEPDIFTFRRASFLSADEGQEPQISDDSGVSIPSKDADCELCSENSVYFSTLSSRIDELGKKTQDLIEKINESRAVDQEIMNSFQQTLTQKVNSLCQQAREQMFNIYEENSHLMETGLRELSEILDQSTQLSTELQSASLTLVAINKGLHHTPMS